MNYKLENSRLETKFEDAKPLYSETDAKIEANRCLYCYDAPCIKHCPTAIDIPSFIRKIVSGNIWGSAKIIFDSNILGVSTARVCPTEVLCVGACVLTNNPIQIGRLQRFVTHQALELETKRNRSLFKSVAAVDKKVAFIGAGPASLSCAGYLALEGVKTVIYEKSDLPGGLNLSGIAPYKFMATDALDEIDWLRKYGLNIKTGVQIGRDKSLEDLITEYDAVFLGVGKGKDLFPGIPGEELENVWGATDLIRKIKKDIAFLLPKNLTKVVILGGGNTAIDIARELAMLAVPEVDIVYRRTREVMPGYRHELTQALEHGVRLIEKQSPVKISTGSDGRLQLHTRHTHSKAPMLHHADWIIMAIGQLNCTGEIDPQLNTNKKGHIKVDETLQTSIKNLYAGGDCINGGKEVVNAVADGRKAAHAMLKRWKIYPVNSIDKIESVLNG